MKKENKIISSFLIGALLLAVATLLPFLQSKEHDGQHITEEFQQQFLKQEQQRDLLFNEFIELSDQSIDSLFHVYAQLGTHLFESKGIGFLLYRQNQLVFWSNNNIPAPKKITDQLLQDSYVHLGNGNYVLKTVQEGQNLLIALLRIETVYNHENQYLRNKLFNVFRNKNIEGTQVLSKGNRKNDIFDGNQNYLFSLQFKSTSEKGGWFGGFAFLLTLLGILFILRAFELKFVAQSGKKVLWIASIGALLFFIRLLMIQYRYPEALYEIGFFHPTYFANSYFFSSIGDLIMNISLLFYMAYLIQSHIEIVRRNVTDLTPVYRHGISFFLILTTWLLAFFSTHLVQGIVENSTLHFDTSDLFELSWISYVSLSVLGVLFFSFFLFLDKITNYLVLALENHFQLILLYSLFGLLFYQIIGKLEWSQYSFVESLWSIPVFIVIVFFKRAKRKYYSFSMLILLLLFFSAVASIVIAKNAETKELNERKFLVNKISLQTDPVAEYLFDELRSEILEDQFIDTGIAHFWENEMDIKEHLEKKYFSGFWDKYDFQIVACDMEDSILIDPGNINAHCVSYFSYKITDETIPTSYQNLYHFIQEDGTVSYIAKIEFKPEGSPTKSLFIEFHSKPFFQNAGYPELLLGQKEIDQTIDFKDYSFARYQNEQLLSSVGDFNYPLSFNFSAYGNFDVYTNNGYSHLLHRPNERQQIVLSRKYKGGLQVTILFSFLFSLFSLIFFFFSITIKGLPSNYDFSISSFGSKLQLILVLVILFVLVSLGVGATYYIKQQYNERNDKYISEKIRSVLTELEHKLGREEFIPLELPADFEDYLNLILIKFSNVFYTDINLYGLDGQLIATSREEIFKEGLKGRPMDVMAFKEMSLDKKSLFINEERIGKLSYLSAYVPFRNNDNELLAYLNLPYFAKQDELEKDLGNFLIALVNSYIFLIALVIIIAVVFADYLSRPLKLISAKIRQLQLGGENEVIEWEGEDEIGVLVKEYNKMVGKLSKSAELLARSEREGAWRDMAKQVAHEIKNPLTPMKLSVQHLKRAFDDGATDINERVEKVSTTLIDQIDSLTRIADEFSNFAKMPIANRKKMNIKELLQSSVSLFEDHGVDLKLTHQEGVEDMRSFVDKEHIQRVFNNLLKNAIQSIPKSKEGKIEVHLSKEDRELHIAVADNGIGIDDEQKDKIFSPSFTTKSGGMGLGLVMVKNIIESFEGRISFESTLGEGTTFHVYIPIHFDE